jgi:hypothetical protein
MPYALVPPGYQAVLLGQALRLEDLGTFTPLEENTDEGALVLMRLDFGEPLTNEALAQLNQACWDKGVPAWPSYDCVVYADTMAPSVYLAWQKGQAFMPIIVGILVTVVVPPLLGALIWRLLPQSVKSTITGIINLGIMMLVMWLMTTLMKPLTSAEKPKKVKASTEKPEQLEEAKT